VARPAGTFAGLTLTDHRRALKLKALNTLGLPYHYDPVLPLKRTLLPNRYAAKQSTLAKAITPADVSEFLQRLQTVTAGHRRPLLQ